MNALLLASSDGDWHGHWFWFAPFWILLWILFFFTVARFFWWGGRRRRPLSPDDRAREILAERYARGEIDAAEYRSRLDGLAR